MNETVTMPAFLEKLRSATSQSHIALEALPISSSVMDPDVSDAAYTAYLALMQDVVVQAEAEIFPKITGIITDTGARRKAHFIAADLKDLGHGGQSASKPFGNTSGFSTAFALGIAYVVEGSSLGGRVILKNINTVLGYDAQRGARYFAGYGGQTGSHWKTFLNALVNCEGATGKGDEIIAGANFAFDAISAHFTTNAPR